MTHEEDQGISFGVRRSRAREATAVELCARVRSVEPEADLSDPLVLVRARTVLALLDAARGGQLGSLSLRTEALAVRELAGRPMLHAVSKRWGELEREALAALLEDLGRMEPAEVFEQN